MVMMSKVTEMLTKTVDVVMASEDAKEAVLAFSTFIDEHGWPVAVIKSEVIKGLNLIIEEKLPNDPCGDLVNLLIGVERKAIKITDNQRKLLKEIAICVEKAKKSTCEHNNIGISAFVHGGGFSPIINLPEIICLDCGLNVTLRNYKKDLSPEEEYGIIILPDNWTKLFKWASEQKTEYAEIITKNPIEAYNVAPHWEGELPFIITDAKVLEAKSGL